MDGSTLALLFGVIDDVIGVVTLVAVVVAYRDLRGRLDEQKTALSEHEKGCKESRAHLHTRIDDVAASTHRLEGKMEAQ